LGIVVNIQNFGASDLLEVENNFQKKYYIPIDDDNIMNMDTRNKIIIVNPMLGILE
jgi:ribosomal 30S subunit maturation factor RimM